MRLSQFFRVALFLLVLSLLTESLGYLTHQLYNFLGILFLSCYGLSVYPFGATIRRRGLFLLGCLFLILSFLFLTGSILERLGGAGIFLFALGLLIRAKDGEEQEISVLFLTVTVTFCFFLFYLFSPPFWHILREFSLGFSQTVSRGAGIQILLSSTFIGLPITVIFLIFILFAFLCSEKKRPFLFYLSLVFTLALTSCYLMVMAYAPFYGKALINLMSDEGSFLRLFLGFLFEKDYPLTRYNYQMNGPIVLFIFYLVPLFLILWGRTIKPGLTTSKSGNFKNGVIFLLLTVLATAVLTFDLPGTTSAKKQVVLYNQGFLNWQVPSFRMFGSRSAGMFGNLPLFLNALGFSTTKVDTISPDNLQEAKILMMINVDREIPREELEAIWNFVEEGGSLLLLGDHTFYKHEIKRIILNDILQPYDIRYNFDSADWFVGGWLHSYRYASHPITAGMRDDMNDAGSVIGASLQAEPPAFPLLIGKYGYSDPGNELDSGQRGYLGNLNYDPGEPLGDIVLCAAQHYGKGKVIVFGDTSGFANAILVNSHDFVNRVFTWLSKDESPRPYRLALFISLSLILLALFFFLRSTRSAYLLLMVIVVGLAVVRIADLLNNYKNHRALRGTIAYVDSSHGERFSPESWNENAVLGLHLNLMRNGYLSFTLRDFEEKKLEGADLLVLIAPSSPFRKKEIGWIKDFVSRGGNLILTVGWEEREASLPLMNAFGFSVDYLPLAQFISVIPQANQRVRFVESWPLISTDGQSEVLAAYQKLPVIMKRPFGKGTVVMIGDSSFFWNKNLEMEESHVQENVEFLKWLLGSHLNY